MIIFLMLLLFGVLIGAGYRVVKVYYFEGDNYDCTPGPGTLFMITLFCSFIFIMLWGVIVAEHTRNLGEIRTSEQYIENYNQRIVSLKADIKTILGSDPTPDRAILLNADSPIKSMVEQLGVAESDLTTCRHNILKNQAQITARKAGPWWFIVSVYGER